MKLLLFLRIFSVRLFLKALFQMIGKMLMYLPVYKKSLNANQILQSDLTNLYLLEGPRTYFLAHRIRISETLALANRGLPVGFLLLRYSYTLH